MDMKGESSFGEFNDSFNASLTTPTNLLSTPTVTPTITPVRRNEDDSLDIPEGMQSYLELVAENLELKKLLELHLAEVEQHHVLILETNEQLFKENVELKRKVEEKDKKLEKSEKQLNLLQSKLDSIKGRFQMVNLVFTDMAKEIDDDDDGTWNESKADLAECSSPNLPTPSGTGDEKEEMSTGKAEIPQVDYIQFTTPMPKLSPSESTDNNLRRSQRSSVVKGKKYFSLSPFLSFAAPKRKRSLPGKTQKTKKVVTHEVDITRQDEGFYCVCGTRCNQKWNLKHHIIYSNSKNNGKFVCTVKSCGRRFYTTGKLRDHMKCRHNMEYNKTNGCRTCGQTFPTQMLLLAHYKNIHRRRSLLPLQKSVASTPKLDKTIMSFSSFSAGATAVDTRGVTHGKDASKSKSKTCYCLCGQKFSSEKHLYSHVHYFVACMNFSCNFCEKRCRSRMELQRHMNIKHKEMTMPTGESLMKKETVNIKESLSPPPPLLTPQNIPVEENPAPLSHGMVPEENNSNSNTFRCFCGVEYAEKNGLQEHVRLMQMFSTR